MTIIAALKTDDGRILMGADSAGVGGYSLQNRTDPKIYKNGEFMLGFTSSFRMGQLLGHAMVPPVRYAESKDTIEKFMATTFIDAVRKCLKDGGFAKKENEVESGGNFLVGYRGRIYEIGGDYQVGTIRQDFAAVGCGFDLALGSLYSTDGLIKDPQLRLQVALESAERFSAGVRSPFIFEEQAPWK